MTHKRFRINCIVRVLLLGGTIFLLCYLIFKSDYYFGSLFIIGLIFYQLFSLIHYIEKSNRELSRFLAAIKHSDFSQSFTHSGYEGSSDELSLSFTEVIQAFRQTRAESEIQQLYLETVVQHVGVGLISFQPNGEVELINNAAKQLLNLNRLKNIKILESISPSLVKALLTLKSGEKTLVRVELPHELLQVSISATKFKLQGRNFTLVSLQNIQSELEREQMARELEIARQVQRKLLPKSDPQISGFDLAGICIPAQEVGGDYYDFIPLGNDKLGITIGDVSGKGVPAAIYMTLLKGIVQTLAEENISPKAVLSKVNKFLYRTIERGSFVTLIYAVLDFKHHQLSYARAGHNPIIYFNANEQKYSQLEPAGMALALENGTLFEQLIQEAEINLASGDSLIFYTDGFSEAMNKNHDEYGEGRLLEIIRKYQHQSARHLIDELCANVRQFTAEQPQYDDMTMISLKVE